MTNTEQTVADLDTAAPVRSAGRTVHMPGDGAMWVMVLGDFIIFGAYFIIFMVHRAMTPQEFLESQQHLNINIGVLNTLVLLTSSWFIARSVQAARAGDHDAGAAADLPGWACGVVFILIKAYEWSAKIAQGYTMPSNEFFMFYYMLTGVHLFHVGARPADPGCRCARTAQPATAPHVDGRIRRHLLAHGRPALDRHLRACST